MSSPRKPPPRLTLPASAFHLANSNPAPRRLFPRSLIDSHIHLWNDSQLLDNHVNWPKTSTSSLKNGPHSLDEEYTSVVERGIGLIDRRIKVEGCVYVQVEAEHDDEEIDGSRGGWKSCVDEIDQVCKASGKSRIKVLALCPWAPIHLGPTSLKHYVPHLTSITSSYSIPITSFRYLLQDSPRGFYTTEPFISGLEYLSSLGYAFDLTIDSRKGSWMLEQSVELISSLRQRNCTIKVILDHLGKPDLSNSNTIDSMEQVGGKRKKQEAFEDWLKAIYELSLFDNVFIKLSGLLDLFDSETVAKAFEAFFDESKPVEERDVTKVGSQGEEYKEMKGKVKKVLEPVLEAFGDSRILIGSDWPMFRASTILQKEGPKNRDEEGAAWAFEMRLYLDVLVELGLEGEALDRIFAANAKVAYGISKTV